MQYLFNMIISTITLLATGIMAVFSGDGVWASLTPEKITFEVSGSTAVIKDNAVTSWLPGIESYETVFVIFSLMICISIALFELVKAMLPETGGLKPENPLTVLGRTALSIFAVVSSYSALAIINGVMSKVFSQMPNATEDNGLLEDFTLKQYAPSLASDDIANTLGIDVIVVGLVSMIFIVMVCICFIKLILELIERYVVLIFLFYIAPLPCAALASAETKGIFKSFSRMIFSQYLVIFLNLCFLYVFVYGWQLGCTNLTDVPNSRLGEVILFYGIMIAWLRLGSRLDEHMSAMGLTATRTGAGIGGELLATAAIAKSLGGEMLAAGGKGISLLRNASAGSAAKANSIANEMMRNGISEDSAHGIQRMMNGKGMQRDDELAQKITGINTNLDSVTGAIGDGKVSIGSANNPMQQLDFSKEPVDEGMAKLSTPDGAGASLTAPISEADSMQADYMKAGAGYHEALDSLSSGKQQVYDLNLTEAEKSAAAVGGFIRGEHMYLLDGIAKPSSSANVVGTKSMGGQTYTVVKMDREPDSHMEASGYYTYLPRAAASSQMKLT